MSQYVIFRAGSNLFVGETTEKPNVLKVRYWISNGSYHKMLPEALLVHPDFIVNKNFNLGEAGAFETSTFKLFSTFINRDLMEVMSRFELPGLISYESQNRGLGLVSEGEQEIAWTPLAEILYSPIAHTVTLESVRDRLIDLQLVNPVYVGTVESGTVVIDRTRSVYMKHSDFRDITKLGEGTELSVIGYKNGCVTVEADGEEFWLPIEEAFYGQPEYKDDEYYFTLDADHDNVPDPINFSPAHVALGGNVPLGPDTNYNQQPSLELVAGHFMPGDEIENKDTLKAPPPVPDPVVPGQRQPKTGDPMKDLVARILDGEDVNDVLSANPGDGIPKMFK